MSFSATSLSSAFSAASCFSSASAISPGTSPVITSPAIVSLIFEGSSMLGTPLKREGSSLSSAAMVVFSSTDLFSKTTERSTPTPRTLISSGIGQPGTTANSPVPSTLIR